ncbi:hypothetical protein C0J52_13927, partial [Blattella germanica]
RESSEVVRPLQIVDEPLDREEDPGPLGLLGRVRHECMNTRTERAMRVTATSRPITGRKESIEEILVQVFRDSRGPLVHVEGRAAPAHYDHERETLVQHPAFPLSSTYSGTEGLSYIMAT